MKCDVCSEDLRRKNGYILSTSQVVYSPGYWRRAFSLLPFSAEELEGALSQLVKQMSSSESDWTVCEKCMTDLKAARTKPARYFREYLKSGKRPQLRDTGPANLEQAAIVAAGAFEAKFGRKPNTIQFQDSPGEVLTSVEFSHKMAGVLKTGAVNELRQLSNTQVQCGGCGAVMRATECQLTETGMSCPRCDQPWFLRR